jgi:hypothetical protein
MNEIPIWKKQCDAARAMKDAFGPETALAYVIGQKFFDFLRRADRQQLVLLKDLPAFSAEIRTIFRPWEIRAYLDQLGRFRRAAAMADEVMQTKDVLAIVHRMRVLLLAESAVSSTRGDR